MAIHTTLPIYMAIRDLLYVVVEITSNMRRDFKQSLGGRIKDECISLMLMVFRANCAQDKSPHLMELLERLQVVELLLRTSKDLRLISAAQHAKTMDFTDSIGKQANGWRKGPSPDADQLRLI